MSCCEISALNFCSSFVALASVKAGRLLPHLQYQLYAKHKGPLFPVGTLRKTSDVAAPSQAPLQPGTHQKPRPQQHVTQERFGSACQDRSAPQPGLGRPCRGSVPSQFVPQSCAARCACHTASAHTSTDATHRTPSAHPRRPHPNLGQRARQLQPQTDSSCSDARSSCKTVDLGR